MTNAPRAIVGARTSTINADKVSHVVQTETGGAYATTHGMVVVGTFNDLGVSATVSPFKRPDLGPWLSEERQHEYDVIVWSAVDRAFRSTYDCAEVAKWANKHRKVLVFTDGGLTLNYRDDADPDAQAYAEMFVTMSAMFGQAELRRITKRANDRETALRHTDRFARGVPPFGYRVVDHPSGSGKALAKDPEAQGDLHRIAAQLLNGWSLNEITKQLNDNGVQSNSGKAMERATRWSVKNATALLTSWKTQGVKTHNGEPVLDGEGLPIVMAEPTFDPDTWSKIQDKIAERRASGKRRVHSASPVLGVGFCECGASLTPKVSTANGKRYAYYRCGRTPNPCRGVSIHQDTAGELLTRLMTETFGRMKATRRVFVPGSDNSGELATIEQSLTRLRRESDAGLVDDEDEWLGRLSALTARKRELSATPVRSPGWETIEEDETYGERYARADSAERREILRNAGIRLMLHAEGGPTVGLPEPMADALGFDEVPVSSLNDMETPGSAGRILGNYVRATMRGDL